MHNLTFANTLLKRLPPSTIARLNLHRVDLPRGRDLAVIGERIQCLCFLEQGIGSMTTCFENGAQVEVSMFGYESVIGVSALMGVKQSLNRVFMQLAGTGYTCNLQTAFVEFESNAYFRGLMLRFVQAQLTLAMQNAACNSSHSYEQRLARWLLICSERAAQDTLELPQEFVAEMLGSTRSTVSIAAAHLKAKRLIDYSRGHIRLIDKRGLEAESCECYRVVRNHLESFAQFDTEFVT
ncbi:MULTISPECIES: Crp/Fnr family transcriptional regulator [Terriglobus]|uniref:cAMP-binding domain of CRP or a regulatory subunit of cAMP-dependent protein kinases n=1 Tax=Terriglobus roseus TaxID=392734 RepID=A0A1G7HB54_9BACT|nr:MULTISPECIES: Crp/Fnr family transcriptional regulator [Terriglobus]SDE97687.1 cAMP-binding domain of CRP or a regulatory subunit of cAMP-dependent protein kinases [Terriglobus roseus]